MRPCYVPAVNWHVAPAETRWLEGNIPLPIGFVDYGRQAITHRWLLAVRILS